MITGNERNHINLNKILSNKNKDSLTRVPSSVLKSIVVDFIRTHPNDMELLKNGGR